MISDPIMDEVRTLRQEHAARFDYDLKKNRGGFTQDPKADWLARG